MWGRRKTRDVVEASLKETQAARRMITESGVLLDDIEGELLQILSGGARADLDALRQAIDKFEHQATPA
jgi:hypothetical protein